MTGRHAQKHTYDLSHPAHARPPTDLPTRIWRVYRRYGRNENFHAHTCLLSHDGAIGFFNQLPETHELALVKALSPDEWDSVIEIDTPATAPLHLGPYDPCA